MEKINKSFLIFLVLLTIYYLNIDFLNAQTEQTKPNSSLINITLIEPKYGGTQVDRFDLRIKTSNASNCKYTYNPNLNYSEITSPSNFFSTESPYDHIIKDFQLNIPENEEKKIFILCKTLDNNYVNDGFPINFTLVLDRTEPQFLNLLAIPDYVIEKLYVQLIVETDDLTICRFDLTQPDIEEYFSFFNSSNISSFRKRHILTLTDQTTPKLEDNKNYTFFVSCMNLAQLFSKIEKINFKTNLSEKNKILETKPSGIIFNRSLELLVITNRNSNCKYGENYMNFFPQLNKKEHFIQLSNLNEGSYTYKIRCDFDQGEPSTLYQDISFIVSLSSPSNLIINATRTTCDNTSINATFIINNTGIRGYYYTLVNNSNYTLLSNLFTSSSFINIEYNFTRGETYYLLAYAQNIAGQNSSIVKSQSIYINPESECFLKPPVLNLSAIFTGKNIMVNLSCSDVYGQCTINYSFSDVCNNSRRYLSTINIDNTTNLCYFSTNSKNLTTQKVMNFKIENCTETNITECCLRKKALQCVQDVCVKLPIICDTSNLDSDEDGILDVDEERCGLDKFNSTDADADFDKDGLTNKEECLTYKTDIRKKDTDEDGADDKIEIEKKTDPLDKTKYPNDLDTDKDGISNKKEIECGLNPNKNDADDDNDEDGLTNKEECLTYGTKVDEKDSDGDGFSDKIEIEKETDPLDSESYPKNYTITIILIILLVSLLSVGIYFVIKKMPKSSFNINLTNTYKKTQTGIQDKQTPNTISQNKFENPNINHQNLFQKTQMQNQQSFYPNPEFKEIKPNNDYRPIAEADPDYLIKRKKEQLKLRKMKSIFDEFAEQKETEKEKSEKEDVVFDELDNLAKKRLNRK